jgi:hypothetical protein
MKFWNLRIEEEEKEEILTFLAFACWHNHSTKPKIIFYQRNRCHLLSTKKTIVL